MPDSGEVHINRKKHVNMPVGSTGVAHGLRLHSDRVGPGGYSGAAPCAWGLLNLHGASTSKEVPQGQAPYKPT